jgi:hypothetical protein
MNIDIHTLNGQRIIQIFQLEISVALSTLKALNQTAYESWNVGELLLNQWRQRLYHSCKNHMYLLCSNKIFRCRIESMRNYYSCLKNFYVPKFVTASLRHSKETEYFL